MSEVKKAAREFKSRLVKKETIKDVKKQVKLNEEERKVRVTWNLLVGDTVKFSIGDEVHFGLIIKQTADGTYKNVREAKHIGSVLVMSSAGRQWLSPNKLEKIEA